MPFSYVQFMTELMAPKPYPRQPVFAPPGLTPLRKSISRSTIGVFTSAGIQLRSDTPLAETNDLSYRLIDRSVPYSETNCRPPDSRQGFGARRFKCCVSARTAGRARGRGTIGRLASRAVSWWARSQHLPGYCKKSCLPFNENSRTRVSICFFYFLFDPHVIGPSD